MAIVLVAHMHCFGILEVVLCLDANAQCSKCDTPVLVLLLHTFQLDIEGHCRGCKAI